MTDTDTTPETGRPYHHGDLKRALVEAGLQLLLRDGPDALSLRAVAREAGVSQAAPYNHFEDRSELFAAISTIGFRSLAEEMQRTIDEKADKLSRTECLGLGYIRFAMKSPQLVKLMFGPYISNKHDYPELAEAAEASATMLEMAVEAVLKETPESGVTVEEGTVAAWALVHGLALLLIDQRVEFIMGEEVDADALALKVLQTFRLG